MKKSFKIYSKQRLQAAPNKALLSPVKDLTLSTLETISKDSKDPTSIYVTEWHKDKDDCHTYRLSVQALNEAMRERN